MQSIGICWTRSRKWSTGRIKDSRAKENQEAADGVAAHGLDVARGIVNMTNESGGVHAIVVDSVKNGVAYIRDPWPRGVGSAYSVPVNALQGVLTRIGVIIHP